MWPSVTVLFLRLGQAANMHSQAVKRIRGYCLKGFFSEGEHIFEYCQLRITVSASVCNIFKPFYLQGHLEQCWISGKSWIINSALHQVFCSCLLTTIKGREICTKNPHLFLILTPPFPTSFFFQENRTNASVFNTLIKSWTLCKYFFLCYGLLCQALICSKAWSNPMFAGWWKWYQSTPYLFKCAFRTGNP